MSSGHHSMLASQKSIGSTFTATTDQRCGKRRLFCFSLAKPELTDICNKRSLKEVERSRLARSDVSELSTKRWQWALRYYSVSSMIIFVSSHLQLIKAHWLFCWGLEMNCACSGVSPCPYLWIISSINKNWKQTGLFPETFLREAWQKWNSISMYTAYIVNILHKK